MGIDIACFVESQSGRDKGKYFLVIGTQDEYALIADGRGRRIDKPKMKKHKHLKVEDKADGLIAEKLTSGGKVTNNDIRKALAQFAADREEKGGM